MQKNEYFLNSPIVESIIVLFFFLFLVAWSFVRRYFKKYSEESGKQKAEIQSLDKKLEMQHEYNKKLESEKKSINEDLESIKYKFNTQIESERANNSAKIEHLKQEHSLEIENIKNKNAEQLEHIRQGNVKRKLQYETKQKEFREFTNLLSSINLGNSNFLVDSIGQTMLAYQAASFSEDRTKAAELMTRFNQVAFDFTSNQTKNLAKIHGQTNGILLSTSSEKIRNALEALSNRIRKAKNDSEHYLNAIGNGQVDINMAGRIFEHKFTENGLEIEKSRAHLIFLMREELDNI